MFDSQEVFDRVIDKEELNDKYTIIQCCSNRDYRDSLQRICELASLATYQNKVLYSINNMEVF